MSSATSYPHGVRRPQQQRSSRTLERILDGAETLLDGRDFEEVTILEILEAADVSSSSLYGRFGDKEALLRALHVRHFEGVRKLAEATSRSAVWDELELDEIVRRLIRILLHYRRQNGERVRTFRRAELKYGDFRERRHALDTWMILTVSDYLRHRLAERGQEFDPKRFTLGAYLVACSIEAAASAPDGIGAELAPDDDWLAEELTQMMSGYLQLGTDAMETSSA